MKTLSYEKYAGGLVQPTALVTMRGGREIWLCNPCEDVKAAITAGEVPEAHQVVAMPRTADRAEPDRHRADRDRGVITMRTAFTPHTKRGAVRQREQTWHTDPKTGLSTFVCLCGITIARGLIDPEGWAEHHRCTSDGFSNGGGIPR
jgi:hypothetical protein